MSNFSTTWKSSTKPGKQHKYIGQAPLHVRSKLLISHLSDELAKKYLKRSARVKKGDRVKIIKGQFAGKTGKVEKVDTKNMKVYIEGAEIQKKDGSKIKYPIVPANLLLVEFDLSDKKRQEILKRK
jgi:large subunit ribosomal protein L24